MTTDPKVAISKLLSGIEGYQFYPEYFNAEVTKLVLLKALTSRNTTDFILCKYLIQLDRSRLKENPQLASNIPGFKDSIVNFIVQVISQTYQRIPKSLMKRFLDVSDKELQQLIKTNDWTESVDSGEPVISVKRHEEIVKSVKIEERVNFDSITSMAGAFRPSKGEFFIKTGSS